MLPKYGIKIKYLGLFVALLLMVCFPVPGISAQFTTAIAPGLNVAGIPSALVAGKQTAFPLLASWQSAGATAIESYDATSGTLLRAELDGSGNPSGVDFSLVENRALYVYSTRLNTLSLGNSQSCASLNLSPGFNLASYACFPSGYLASNFFNSVGLANITSLSRLDLQSGRWQTAAVSDGVIVGDDFPLIAGEGYVIQSAAVSGWSSPTIGLTPAALNVWQGQPDATLTVSLPAAAPAGGTTIDIVSSNPALANVTSPAIVPQGATSVSVPITLPDTGIVTTQSVTVTASRIGMTSAQSALSVRPKPTINLSPLTTLTGLTFTYLLTVNLSDVAPPGGFPVTLTATPAGVVRVPATITIPAGANSTQVTVTATAVGNATITATSPDRGFSGSQNSVTVKPIQTMNYGPLISPEIGIQVGPPATTSTSADATYTPVASAEVGVVVGSVFTGISPNHGAIGSTALPVTISGYGLNAVTGISLYPATGITAGSPAVAPDGTSATVLIDIAANAPVTDRTVVVTTATGNTMSSRAGTGIFKVTYLPPEIYSIQPLRAMVGQTVSMTISGKNLNWASSVDVKPSTGIVFSNPPTVNAAGTGLTVTLTVAADAPTGGRVVTVTTPGGTSTAVASEANSFSVTADAGTTHTSLVSTEVGVRVQTAAASANQDVSYGPTVSVPVGVMVGSAVTSVTPVSGAIGAIGVTVRVLGIGLDSATALSFYPPDGITVYPETFAIDGDGNPEVTIDIAANAPVTARTVLVALSSGGYALPAKAASNQFRVTLQQPDIYSIQPLRAMVGQTVTMTITGKNLASAGSVDFNPPTGIYVVNPPTVNPAGTMITVTVNVAADAPLGGRVVTVTTPGGVSNAVSDTTNSFSVTSDPGSSHTALVSPEVGVLVSLPTATSNQVTMAYGQIASTEVGVMVTPVAAATSQNVDFGPVVSTQIGVAVGGVFTGFSPKAIEPGSSATYTVTGAGLGTVTAVTVVPSDNLTVMSWTPSGDGLSGTVTITANSSAVSGTRTLVLMASDTALMPSAPGINILQVGYKPGVNSITTTFPYSSVQATVGTTYTLTLNGVHLQGVTKADIIPSTGVTIDSMPTWFTDGNGEHVSVKIVVDTTAPPSDRLVQLTTQYGSSSTIPDTSNTLSIFKPLVSSVSQDSGVVRVAADKPSGMVRDRSVATLTRVELAALPARKGAYITLADFSSSVIRTGAHKVISPEIEMQVATTALQADSRGPPEA